MPAFHNQRLLHSESKTPQLDLSSASDRTTTTRQHYVNSTGCLVAYHVLYKLCILMHSDALDR